MGLNLECYKKKCQNRKLAIFQGKNIASNIVYWLRSWMTKLFGQGGRHFFCKQENKRGGWKKILVFQGKTHKLTRNSP